MPFASAIVKVVPVYFRQLDCMERAFASIVLAEPRLGF
jgi:hypothetical protein